MAEQTLKDKIAIVTGASRGIGAGIALELAKRGAKVLLTYTSASSEEAVSNLVNEINSFGSGAESRAHKISADLREVSSPAKIVSEALSFFQTDKIDILVNNAGWGVLSSIGDFKVEDYAKVFDLNVRAPMLMMQAVLPHLGKLARIVNISSIASRTGFAECQIYCSSKAALEGVTRSWAAELGKDGHTVNCVHPGPVRTELLKALPDEVVALQESQTPMQNRVGTEDDIAQIVAFFAEERSRWLTGQCVSASGGLAMW